MSNTNEIKLLKEIRDGILNGSGNNPTAPTELDTNLFEATTNGTIAAGALHISVNVISGTGTFDGYAIDVNNTPIDYPYIPNKIYPAIDYTVASPTSTVTSKLQILVVRNA